MVEEYLMMVGFLLFMFVMILLIIFGIKSKPRF